MMRLTSPMLTLLIALIWTASAQAATSNVCLPLYNFEYGASGWYYIDSDGVKQTDLWRLGVGIGGSNALKIPADVAAIHHDSPSVLPGTQLCFHARAASGALGEASALWVQDNQDLGCASGCFATQYPPRPPCPKAPGFKKPPKNSGLSLVVPAPLIDAFDLYQFPAGVHQGPECVLPTGATIGVMHNGPIYIDNIGVMFTQKDCLEECTGSTDCDDQDPCTQDQCVGAQCINTPINGCCENKEDCGDGDPCTIDQCLNNGTCHYIPRPGCCGQDSDCADDLPCTIDTCESHQCVNLMGCDDGFDCTTDTCDPDTALCSYVPQPDACPTPQDPCVTVSCVPGQGCVEEALDCDDGHPCTMDSCDPTQGCVHENTCDDGNPCTDDQCSDEGECEALPNDAPCDDGDSCTGGTPAPCEGKVTISTVGKCLFGLADGPVGATLATDTLTTGGCGADALWELTLEQGGQYSFARISPSGEAYCLSTSEPAPSPAAETPCTPSGVWTAPDGALWYQRWDIVEAGDTYRIQRLIGAAPACLQQGNQGLVADACPGDPSPLDSWTILGSDGEPCTYQDQCSDGVCGGAALAIAGDGCDNAIEIPSTLGTSLYEGTLECLADQSAMLCGGESSPEALYTLTLHDPTLVSARVLSSHDAVLYMASSCESAEVPCANDNGLGQAELLEEVLEPGTWFIAVDGVSGTESGGYSLEVTLTAIEPTYPLTVDVQGSGEVSSEPEGILCGALCNADFAQGSFVTLSAEGIADAPFLGWIGGGCEGSLAPCIVEMSSAQFIIARFGEVPDVELVLTQYPPALTASTQALFEFTSNVSDPLYTCQLDSEPSFSCTSPLSLSGLDKGEHTLLVRVTRPDDGAQASQTIEWKVDLSAPETTIVSGPELITWSDDAMIEFVASEADATFTCRHQGPQGMGPWFACASPLELPSLLSGWHTLSVFATDIAGNVDLTPAQLSWQVRVLDTIILSGPPAFSSAPDALFELQSSEPQASLFYTLNGGPATATGPQLTLTNLALGPYTLKVWSEVIVDGQLLIDDTPATWSWTQVPAGPLCGNGITEGDEVCDDGNQLDGDTCSKDCKTDCDVDDDAVIAVACGGLDCDDTNAGIKPGVEELCGDGVDNDCDPETLDPCPDPCEAAPPSCDNDAPCVTSEPVCDADTGWSCMTKAAADGSPCDDGDSGTVNDACKEGLCVGSALAESCLCDGNMEAEGAACWVDVSACDDVEPEWADATYIEGSLACVDLKEPGGDARQPVCIVVPSGEEPGQDNFHAWPFSPFNGESVVPVESCGAVSSQCDGSLGSCKNDDPPACTSSNPCVTSSALCGPKGWFCHEEAKTDYYLPCNDGDQGTIHDICVDGVCRGTEVPPHCACDGPEGEINTPGMTCSVDIMGCKDELTPHWADKEVATGTLYCGNLSIGQEADISTFVPYCLAWPDEAEPDIKDFFIAMLWSWGEGNPPPNETVRSCAPVESPCGTIRHPCDQDGDGFWALECGGGDCDDAQANVYPGAEEICVDGFDNDCNPETTDLCGDDCDRDMDGFKSVQCGGDDCDDSSWLAHPGLQEVCDDGLDNDCKPETPDVCTSLCDQDADGYTRDKCGGDDCNDLDAEVYPGAAEVCNDAIDSDCSGSDTDECTLSGLHKVEDAHAQLIGQHPHGRFGVAMSPVIMNSLKDWDYVVVGAPADLEEQGVGRTYVIDYRDLYSGGVIPVSMGQKGVIAVIEGEPGTLFGAALSSGKHMKDTSTIVVGSPLAKHGGPDTPCRAGAIHAFRMDGVIGKTEPITTSAAMTEILGTNVTSKVGCFDDNIGAYIDALGDLNQDGHFDLLSNSRWMSALDQSNAYAYYDPFHNNQPEQEVITTPSLTFENPVDAVGTVPKPTQVVHLEDINADGFSDLAIAYTKDSTEGTNSGAIYLFFGPFEAESVMSTANADAVIRGAHSQMHFGHVEQGFMSVTDATGDGVPDLMVTHGPESEMVGAYVFQGPITGDLTSDQASAVWVGAAADRPHTISHAGDVNSDGFPDVILGAPHATRLGDEEIGAAYLFFGPVSGTLAIEEADVIFEGNQPGALFGYQVGKLGDIADDLSSDIIITAPGHDDGDKLDVGAAFIWQGVSD